MIYYYSLQQTNHPMDFKFNKYLDIQKLHRKVLSQLIVGDGY